MSSEIQESRDIFEEWYAQTYSDYSVGDLQKLRHGTEYKLVEITRHWESWKAGLADWIGRHPG